MTASNSPFATAPHVDALLQLQGESLIRAAYHGILGREVDESGLSSHLANLRSGQDPRLLVLAIASSPEARARQGQGQQPPGLEELARRVAAEVPSRWRRWVQTKFWRLQQPLMNRLAVLDDQVDRSNRLLAAQAATIQQLLELNRRQVDCLEELQRQMGESAPRKRLSGTELAEWKRLGPMGQSIYQELRAARQQAQSLQAA